MKHEKIRKKLWIDFALRYDNPERANVILKAFDEAFKENFSLNANVTVKDSDLKVELEKAEGISSTAFGHLSKPTDPRAIGELEGFPSGLIDLAIQRVIDKHNVPKEDALSVLQLRGPEGCFKISNTPEGWGFWIQIFIKNFSVFFEKYPDGKFPTK